MYGVPFMSKARRSSTSRGGLAGAEHGAEHRARRGDDEAELRACKAELLRKLGAFASALDEMLESNARRPKRGHLTFQRLYEGLEHILQSNGLYIHAGTDGDRLIHDPDRPKMLIEVLDTGLRPVWDKLYFDAGVNTHERKGLAAATRKKQRKPLHQGIGVDEGRENSWKSPSTLSRTISLMPVGLV